MVHGIFNLDCVFADRRNLANGGDASENNCISLCGSRLTFWRFGLEEHRMVSVWHQYLEILLDAPLSRCWFSFGVRSLGSILHHLNYVASSHGFIFQWSGPRSYLILSNSPVLNVISFALVCYLVGFETGLYNPDETGWRRRGIVWVYDTGTWPDRSKASIRAGNCFQQVWLIFVISVISSLGYRS